MKTYDLNAEHTAAVRAILRTFRPHKMKRHMKTRVGRNNDGGYVMVDDFENIDAAYSIGINDDSSWDEAIAAREITVYQYDHTIAAPPTIHPLLRWRKTGLDAATDHDRSLLSLHDMLEQNSNQASTNLILKCDIEGLEWEVLSRGMNDQTLLRFRQIVMEVHCFEALDKSDWLRMFEKGCALLRRTHLCVHVHANNCAPWCVVGGVAMPSVIEVTMYRRDLDEFAPSEEVFPTSLDMPCEPTLADFFLGSFAY